MKAVSSKKERDKAVILDVVRRFGPLSRVDIHRMTHLRPAGISMLVRELLREERLLEVGQSDNPMGRKQILLRLNEEHQFIVALEFDAEAVTAAVLNLGAKVVHSIAETTRLEGGIEALVAELVACTRRVMAEARLTAGSVAGIAVADPGLINSREGVTISSSTIEFWRGVPLKKIFEEEFGVPFLLESNTRARTVAERMRGAGAMAEDMVYLDYGTGIGLGVIMEGRLVRGRGECACEFGHTHVFEGGPACNCGSFGCLEAMVGAPAIAARARSAVLEGGYSMALELAGGDPGRITGWDVLRAAGRGDKMCAAILEDVERYVGLGLANVVNLFNPSLVVLDRRLNLAGSSLLDQIARIVRRQALARSSEGLEFRFSQLSAEAGVLGAGLLLLERLFEIPALKLPKFMTEPAGDLAGAGARS